MNYKLIVAGALALPMAAQAVEFSASGHVNRMLRFSDNGVTETWTSADASNSGSRFRFTGSGESDDGLTVGVNLEFSIAPGLRHANVSIGGDFGALALGHTATATNGRHHDLSNSGLAVDIACGYGVGAKPMSTPGFATEALKVALCTDLTAGRAGTVRFDSAALGPVSFSAGVLQDFWDVKLTAAGDMGENSYAASVSYAKDDGPGLIMAIPNPALLPPDDSVKIQGESIVAAGAVKIASGASVSVTWGQMDDDADVADGSYYAVKLGYDWGDNGVGLMYRQSQIDDVESEPTVWGIGYQRELGGDTGASVYLTYYTADLDDGSNSAQSFLIGTRVTF